jgi:hypothetical protein
MLVRIFIIIVTVVGLASSIQAVPQAASHFGQAETAFENELAQRLENARLGRQQAEEMALPEGSSGILKSYMEKEMTSSGIQALDLQEYGWYKFAKTHFAGQEIKIFGPTELTNQAISVLFYGFQGEIAGAEGLLAPVWAPRIAPEEVVVIGLSEEQAIKLDQMHWQKQNLASGMMQDFVTAGNVDNSYAEREGARIFGIPSTSQNRTTIIFQDLDGQTAGAQR